MKRQWLEDELAEQFSLTPEEQRLVAGKDRSEPNRLGFAVLLKFYAHEGRFPKYKYEVPKGVVEHIARELELGPELFKTYPWTGRTIKTHRAQIRSHFGFRQAREEDVPALIQWLLDEVLIADTHPEFARQRLLTRCHELKVEPPSSSRIERIIRSALRRYERAIAQRVAARLPEQTCRRLDALLEPYKETGYTVFRFLDREPGRTSLATAEREIDKLKRIRALGLPENLFEGIPARLLEQYRQRASAEPPRELRRHPAPVRYTLLAAFCQLRSQQITDTLAELLIQLPRKMEANAEKAIEQAYLSDIKTVRGKHTLLFNLAEAALEHPDGTVREVLYPVVSPETLRDLVREFRASGLPYAQQVYTRMRSSYSHHYRRLMPALVEALRFRCNNEQHQPVVEALELIQRHLGRKTHHFDDGEVVPLDDVVPPDAEHLVLHKTEAGAQRVNRIGYEVCTLLALRERLRSKAVWIEGARRFGNPDQDVPEDFAVHRTAYYWQLNLPLEAEAFITGLRERMQEALEMLDRGMPRNDGVRIRPRRGGWISVTPLEKLPDPPNIEHLKDELGRRWPLTSLLDILKETDLRVPVTDAFTSSGTRERLDRRTLQKRLLLCLYGLGTNTGLKRMSAADQEVSYDDLLYVRRRFIRQDSLREAIVRVSNALFRARLTHIWGEATTACASDAKKFGAWDQNLMTEWHIRYRGPGIMIYWHVEKGTCCIYSQLKRPSSSEVAAMIQGLLSHGTEMDVQKNYVDTHGLTVILTLGSYHALGEHLRSHVNASSHGALNERTSPQAPRQHHAGRAP